MLLCVLGGLSGFITLGIQGSSGHHCSFILFLLYFSIIFYEPDVSPIIKTFINFIAKKTFVIFSECYWHMFQDLVCVIWFDVIVYLVLSMCWIWPGQLFNRPSPFALRNFMQFWCHCGFPSPPVDSIWAVMLVWRLRGKIIRTAPCCVVYNSCTQRYAHRYEQFLQFCGLGFVTLGPFHCA